MLPHNHFHLSVPIGLKVLHEPLFPVLVGQNGPWHPPKSDIHSDLRSTLRGAEERTK